jgi:hypothetical protein
MDAMTLAARRIGRARLRTAPLATRRARLGVQTTYAWQARVTQHPTGLICALPLPLPTDERVKGSGARPLARSHIEYLVDLMKAAVVRSSAPTHTAVLCVPGALELTARRDDRTTIDGVERRIVSRGGTTMHSAAVKPPHHSSCTGRVSKRGHTRLWWAWPYTIE